MPIGASTADDVADYGGFGAMIMPTCKQSADGYFAIYFDRLMAEVGGLRANKPTKLEQVARRLFRQLRRACHHHRCFCARRFRVGGFLLYRIAADLALVVLRNAEYVPFDFALILSRMPAGCGETSVKCVVVVTATSRRHYCRRRY